jgi:hypothetical protein
MNASLWDRPAEMSVIVTVTIIVVVVEGVEHNKVIPGVKRLRVR